MEKDVINFLDTLKIQYGAAAGIVVMFPKRKDGEVEVLRQATRPRFARQPFFSFGKNSQVDSWHEWAKEEFPGSTVAAEPKHSSKDLYPLEIGSHGHVVIPECDVLELSHESMKALVHSAFTREYGKPHVYSCLNYQLICAP
jgi:hypothetical protein